MIKEIKVKQSMREREELEKLVENHITEVVSDRPVYSSFEIYFYVLGVS